MRLRALACCFGLQATKDKDADKHAEAAVTSSSCIATREAVEASTAAARLDTPWTVCLDTASTTMLATSTSPLAILALRFEASLNGLDDASLMSFLECVYLNAALQGKMGATSPQAYYHLLFKEMANAETNLLLEVREAMRSLYGPTCHTPLLAVASVTAGLSATPVQHPSCHQPVPRPPNVAASTYDDGGVVSDGFAESFSSNPDDFTYGHPYSQYRQSGFAGLEGLRLHPCWVYQSSHNTSPRHRRPGVILWHRQPLSWRHSRAVALRSLSLLSHLDSAVTLISSSGRVVYQNAASRRYHGHLLGRPQGPSATPQIIGAGGSAGGDDSPAGVTLTGPDMPSPLAGEPGTPLRDLRVSYLLQRLFSCDVQHLADDMLRAWAAGRTWKRLLHVPPPVGPLHGSRGRVTSPPAAAAAAAAAAAQAVCCRQQVGPAPLLLPQHDDAQWTSPKSAVTAAVVTAEKGVCSGGEGPPAAAASGLTEALLASRETPTGDTGSARTRKSAPEAFAASGASVGIAAAMRGLLSTVPDVISAVDASSMADGGAGNGHAHGQQQTPGDTSPVHSPKRLRGACYPLPAATVRAVFGRSRKPPPPSPLSRSSAGVPQPPIQPPQQQQQQERLQGPQAQSRCLGPAPAGHQPHPSTATLASSSLHLTIRVPQQQQQQTSPVVTPAAAAAAVTTTGSTSSEPRGAAASYLPTLDFTISVDPDAIGIELMDASQTQLTQPSPRLEADTEPEAATAARAGGTAGSMVTPHGASATAGAATAPAGMAMQLKHPKAFQPLAPPAVAVTAATEEHVLTPRCHSMDITHWHRHRLARRDASGLASGGGHDGSMSGMQQLPARAGVQASGRGGAGGAMAVTPVSVDLPMPPRFTGPGTGGSQEDWEQEVRMYRAGRRRCSTEYHCLSMAPGYGGGGSSDEDPLQMSAWRAAIKISQSRRNLATSRTPAPAQSPFLMGAALDIDPFHRSGVRRLVSRRLSTTAQHATTNSGISMPYGSAEVDLSGYAGGSTGAPAASSSVQRLHPYRTVITRTSMEAAITLAASAQRCQVNRSFTGGGTRLPPPLGAPGVADGGGFAGLSRRHAPFRSHLGYTKGPTQATGGIAPPLAVARPSTDHQRFSGVSISGFFCDGDGGDGGLITATTGVMAAATSVSGASQRPSADTAAVATAATSRRQEGGTTSSVLVSYGTSSQESERPGVWEPLVRGVRIPTGAPSLAAAAAVQDEDECWAEDRGLLPRAEARHQALDAATAAADEVAAPSAADGGDGGGGWGRRGQDPMLDASAVQLRADVLPDSEELAKEPAGGGGGCPAAEADAVTGAAAAHMDTAAALIPSGFEGGGGGAGGQTLDPRIVRLLDVGGSPALAPATSQSPTTKGPSPPPPPPRHPQPQPPPPQPHGNTSAAEGLPHNCHHQQPQRLPQPLLSPSPPQPPPPKPACCSGRCRCSSLMLTTHGSLARVREEGHDEESLEASGQLFSIGSGSGEPGMGGVDRLPSPGIPGGVGSAGGGVCGGGGCCGCTSPAAAGLCDVDERCLKWHEVTGAPFVDPITGQRMLLLVQTDVTARVEAERRLVELTAAQTGMLEKMFPRHVLEFVVQQGEAVGAVDFSAHVGEFATAHDMATVLFTEIVGFTAMSKLVPAAAVMSFLSELYSRLDALVDSYGVWKVETAGDCYIVAAGVVQADQDGFHSVVTATTATPATAAGTVTAAAPYDSHCRAPTAGACSYNNGGSTYGGTYGGGSWGGGPGMADSVGGGGEVECGGGRSSRSTGSLPGAWGYSWAGSSTVGAAPAAAPAAAAVESPGTNTAAACPAPVAPCVAPTSSETAAPRVQPVVAAATPVVPATHALHGSVQAASTAPQLHGGRTVGPPPGVSQSHCRMGLLQQQQQQGPCGSVLRGNKPCMSPLRQPQSQPRSRSQPQAGPDPQQHPQQRRFSVAADEPTAAATAPAISAPELPASPALPAAAAAQALPPPVALAPAAAPPPEAAAAAASPSATVVPTAIPTDAAPAVLSADAHAATAATVTATTAAAAAAATAPASTRSPRSRPPDPVLDAEAVFGFAVAILEAARGVRMPHNGEPVQLRVGIHSGPLVSGVIGTKMPKFALFGDTMNTASRMESTCQPGLIQVSAATRALLPHLPLHPTGGVHVKGKGVMETYIYRPSFPAAAATAPADGSQGAALEASAAAAATAAAAQPSPSIAGASAATAAAAAAPSPAAAGSAASGAAGSHRVLVGSVLPAAAGAATEAVRVVAVDASEGPTVGVVLGEET
ncbi:hypothetical protein Agub_g12205 [Astrephomene gubernaculifera]|uniref:Guanylate cyclase domain-containing protein n=1 Tax=Astrephomene gubernaculifera TaxID=47775 RepID=A0AAD3E0L8_9CHLO|nr:hypothetical protein Agub_g12205 [Astrephomene gubernaculifera]